jgi:hypothetical protein
MGACAKDCAMSGEKPKGTLLELAQVWADLISKILGAVALVAAGVWTYTNFTVERTHDPTMQIDIQPEVSVLRGDHVLLNVDVVLQNIGRVAIQPKFAEDAESTSNLGLEISIVEIEAIPGAEYESPVRNADAEHPWFDWTTGAGAPRPVFRKRNLLATNEDFQSRRYQLNPGVKYREPFACLVEKDKLYAVRARFWTQEGSIADLVYVHTFSPESLPVETANQLRPGLK